MLGYTDEPPSLSLNEDSFENCISSHWNEHFDDQNDYRRDVIGVEASCSGYNENVTSSWPDLPDSI